MRGYSYEEPRTLEAVGDGSWLYRYGAEPYAETDPWTGEGRTAWTFEEVRVWGQPTQDAVLAACIADRWTEGEELKLSNEWAAATMGLCGEAEAEARTAAYRAFLEERAALKARVDADCAALGIE